METIRLILFIILAFLLLQIWQTWDQDNQPVEPQQGQQQDYPAAAEFADLPAPVAVDTPSAGLPVLDQQTAAANAEPSLQSVRLETDTFIAEIDPRGAILRKVWLKRYPVSQQDPEDLIELFDDSDRRRFYIQSGAVGASSSPAAPNHTTQFSIEPGAYALADGEDQLEIVATARLETGIEMQKRLLFSRDSYQVKITTTLINRSEQSWQGRFYNQLVRAPGHDTEGSFFTPQSYEGAAYYTALEKYNKTSYDDIAEQPLALQTSDGWVAMLEHYFVAALVPQQIERFYTKALDANRFAIGSLSAAATAAPGEQITNQVVLFVGPKEQSRLAGISPGLELTTDFGMLTFLAQPVFGVLTWLHGLFGNWGWAIIGVTVLLKALFFPLSAIGYRSMAKMKAVQPKMVALREAYADDKSVLNQKMMELYRTEKINPLGGCLPILIQIPVFIALYWVLLESVELRQAGFVLWLTDLSQSDPYYVLPIIMGASMLIQQRMNPAQMDPIQQKVMMAMPVVFTFFFLTFPAGLVLYWVVNNILSILQQWQITRKYAVL